MTRLLAMVSAALALLSTALAPHAQPFPAPGEGVFTWERAGDRPRDFEGLSFAPDGRLFAARDTVFTFDPDPEGAPAGRWRAVGYNGSLVQALLAIDTAGDTLFTGDSGTIRRSVNGGATWTIVNGSLSGTEAGGPDDPDGFHVVPPGHAHAGRLLAGGVILYSDDRGATWHDASQDIPTNQQGFAQTFAVLPSGRTLAGTYGGVLGSDDGGASYLRTPLHGPFVTHALVPLATPGSMQSGASACGLADPALCDGAVAVGYSSQLPHARAWRTADGGRTWAESVALPEPEDGVGNGYTAGVIGLGGGADGLGRAVAVLGRGVIYATADGGQSWEAVGRMPVRLGGASHFARHARLGPDGHLWVSTSLNGSAKEWVYRSAEPATAAFPVASEGLPVGGPPEGVGVTVRPNPAGRLAEVVVRIVTASHVRVVVVDGLGREISVVWSGEAGVGERVFSVDTSGWPAGAYVVRATAGEHHASARLVVAR